MHSVVIRLPKDQFVITTWNTTFWLLWRHMRDVWPGYVWSPVYFVLIGPLINVGNVFALEVSFLLMIFILVQPIFAGRYFKVQRDNEVLRNQAFLRSLPLPVADVVRARYLGMIIAGVINAVAYFPWFWYLQNDWESWWAFAAWSVLWFGVGVASAAISLVQEFWLDMVSWLIASFGQVFGIMGLASILVWGLDISLVSGSISLANRLPLVAAAAGVAIALGSSVLGLRMATDRYQQREFVL